MWKTKPFLCLSLAVVFSGCATTGPVASSDPLALLRQALDASPETLQQAATRHDHQAEYALAIVYAYGLHGIQKDAAKAADLRARAQAAVYTPITQYVPGLHGKPGRTAIINMSTPGVDPMAARSSDACAQSLDDGRSDTTACGDEGRRAEFAAKWREAAGHAHEVSSTKPIGPRSGA